MSIIETIRDNRPHYDRLSLSIYRPNTLFTARVNDASIQLESRSIKVNDLSISGTTSVENKMLLVGSSLGAQDLGKIRMRSMSISASGTYITVGENSDVTWVNTAYLTAIDYVEINPIYPRIIQDSNNAEQTIFYKDYDIPYSNQNNILGAFLCAGSHRSAVLNNQGYVDIYWSATGSYHLANSGLSYSWDFWRGSSGTSSTSQTPGNVRYTQPGFYVTKLRGTGDNGSVDETYRYVSIYRDESSSIQDFLISNIRGSQNEGGYSADITLRESLGYDLYGGELVIITDKAYFNNVQNNVTFDTLQQDNTFFIGYVLKDSIQFDYANNQLNFSIGSVTNVMKLKECFVIDVEDKASPTTWFELNGLTGKTSLYHYLRWHSTVLNTCDFRYVGKDYPIQFFDTDKSSLYDSINNFFSKTYFGVISADIKGRIWADTYPEADAIPTNKVTPIFTLIDDDFINAPIIELRMYKDVSFIDAGGIVYSRESREPIALLCSAPGTAPSYAGKSMSIPSGLSIESQGHLNTIIGNKFARYNSRYKYISLTLSGLYKIDFSRITYISLNLSAEKIGQLNNIIGTFMVTGIDWSINNSNGVLLPTITLEEVSNGVNAQTVVVKTINDDAINGGSFNYSPLELPPLFDIPLPSDPTTLKFVFVNTSPSYGLWYTDEFDQANPRWWSLNYGITGAALNITDFHITPTGRVWAFSLYEIRTGLIGEGKLDVVATYNDIFPQLTGSHEAGIPFFFDGSLNPNNPEEYLIVGGIANVECHLMTINKNGQITRKRGVRPVDALGGYGGNLSFSPSKVIYTYMVFNIVNATAQFNRAMNTQTAFVAPNSFTRWHVNAGNSDLIFGDTIYSRDGGLTTLALGHTGTTNMYGLDTSPDGMFLMKIDDLGNKVRSSDGGNLWGSISALTGTFMPNGVVYNAESRDMWILGSRSRNDFVVEPFKIYYTGDFGEIWENKIGNFYDFLPLYGTNIKQIKAYIV